MTYIGEARDALDRVRLMRRIIDRLADLPREAIPNFEVVEKERSSLSCRKPSRRMLCC